MLAVLLGTTACSAGDPAVELDPEARDVSSRWNAILTSPSDVEGAIRIAGEAWLDPSESDGSTRAHVAIENAAPGGVHPWQVRNGRCGSNAGALGDDAYDPLEVEDDGTATASTTLESELSRTQDYYVAVLASSENRELVIACGNFAPPTN